MRAWAAEPPDAALAKGPDAFRTISEAADELGVQQHVLRFWETRFSFIRPMKRAGGRRFYRPQDIAVLRGVRRLLHDEGYTIKGVQRLHRDEGVKRLVAAGQAGVVSPAPSLAPLSQPAAMAQPAPTAAPVVVEAAPAQAAQGAMVHGPLPLSEMDRRRLSAALQDLTAIKADLDALLAQK